jgi:dUTP pyrophosphatase
MNRIAKFEKVSLEQFTVSVKEFLKDLNENEIEEIYNSIKLPKRATKMSAGYDFYSYSPLRIEPNQTVKIPTGIRCSMVDDYVLLIAPRSSLGFKYRLQLDNTIGVIDSDYYNAKNEGHIFIKITNDSKEGKVVEINPYEAFAQGIFLQYGITVDDDCVEERVGGFGSTNK